MEVRVVITAQRQGVEESNGDPAEQSGGRVRDCVQNRKLKYI